MNKLGWFTSEMTIAGVCGTAIFELASADAVTLANGIMRAAACIALAWIAGKYAHARTEAKRAALPGEPGEP